MDTKARDVLLFNRVKIMKFCDYFVVSAPLIAKRILPLDKHKEFKNCIGQSIDSKASNNARIDSLLEFLDECATPGAFDAFVEGVKNCEGQKTFGKILKKTADGGHIETSDTKPLGPVLAKPILKRISSGSAPSTVGQSQLGNSNNKIENLPIVGPIGILASTPASKKLKKLAPRLSGAKKNVLQNGPSTGNSTNSTTPSGSIAKRRTIQTQKPKKKAGTKIQLNGQGGTIIKQDGIAPSAVPIKKKAIVKKKSGTKIVGPVPLASVTSAKIETEVGSTSNSAKSPGSLTSAKALGSSAPSKSPISSTNLNSAKKPFISRVPAGSPFKRRKSVNSQSKLKKMTFQEVEEKQKSATRATMFSFVNPSAVVKTIHFNNKSDLFYEGCPTKVNNQLCAKKVQLKGKGKKYVCKEKHENESYELFPRLYVTFEDNTTHIQTTLFRENVEVLAGKPVPDIHRMDDETLKIEFLKAHNKNIPIEVKCKKILKKEIKKSGGATWDNVATIITESDEGPSPVKRTRKSID